MRREGREGGERREGREGIGGREGGREGRGGREEGITFYYSLEVLDTLKPLLTIAAIP